MNHKFAALTLLAPFALAIAIRAADEDVRWLVTYDGKVPPAAPWTTAGTPNAKVEADGLRLNDGRRFRATAEQVLNHLLPVLAGVKPMTFSVEHRDAERVPARRVCPDKQLNHS